MAHPPFKVLRLPALSWALSACHSEPEAPRPAIMLRVNTNLAITREIDRVRVEVRRVGETEVVQAETTFLGPGKVMLPAGFEIIPLGSETLHLKIDIVGLLGQVEVARDTSITMVPPGWQKQLDAQLEKSSKVPENKPQAEPSDPANAGVPVRPAIARLELNLDARCPPEVRAQCAENETCHAGVCVPAQQEFSELPLLQTSDIPRASSAGQIEEQCLDVVEAFDSAEKLRQRVDYTFESPSGSGSPNVALVLPAGGDGFCDPARCVLPLDIGPAPSGDWLELDDGSIELQDPLCAQFQDGSVTELIGVRGGKESKTASTLLCPVPAGMEGAGGGGGGGNQGTPGSGGTSGVGAIGEAGEGPLSEAAGEGGSATACQSSECTVVGAMCRDDHTRVNCTKGSNGCVVGIAAVCPDHQACSGVAGAAICACTEDPVCKTGDNTCSDDSTLAGCTRDANGCAFQVTKTVCTNGACSGGACCTNACTVSPKTCSTSVDTVESCDVGSNGCTAMNVGTCAQGEVCERLNGPTCLDPAWAAWPMPNTQTDVKSGAPNPMGYKDLGDGTVLDGVTGLVWQQKEGGTFDAAGAGPYCAGLDLAGYQNWRLPTVIELVSLLDFEHSPKINPTYFPGTTNGVFRSSQRSWNVSFSDGGTGFSNETLKLPVRCVR